MAAIDGSNRKNTPFLTIGTHMDVVPSGNSQEWKYPPFSGTIADAKIWGRGAVDAKCSLAAQLYAMKALLDSKVCLHNSLLCIGTVDDEAPNNEISAGMEYVVGKGLAKLGYTLPKYAINAEASGLGSIWGNFSGELTLKISFKGDGGHPPLGRNALHIAFEFWRILNEKRNRRLLQRPPRLVWLSGGSETDFGITPQKAEMIFKIALLEPRITPSVALVEIRRLAREGRRKEGDQIQVENISILSQGNAFNIGRNSLLVRTIRSSAMEARVKSDYGGGIVGPGDLQFYLQEGIQGVTFGAGSLERCHAPNEFVTIRELVSQAKIYALTAYRLCSKTE